MEPPPKSSHISNAVSISEKNGADSDASALPKLPPGPTLDVAEVVGLLLYEATSMYHEDACGSAYNTPFNWVDICISEDSSARSQACQRGCAEQSGSGGFETGLQFRLFIIRLAKRKFLFYCGKCDPNIRKVRIRVAYAMHIIT
jgi:hypothetical protein